MKQKLLVDAPNEALETANLDNALIKQLSVQCSSIVQRLGQFEAILNEFKSSNNIQSDNKTTDPDPSSPKLPVRQFIPPENVPPKQESKKEQKLKKKKSGRKINTEPYWLS